MKPQSRKIAPLGSSVTLSADFHRKGAYQICMPCAYGQHRFSALSEWLVCCSFSVPPLFDAAILDSYAHVVDEVLRCLIVCMEEVSERDHSMFLHAALAKCERCLAFWLHRGADLNRGAAKHPDWIALEWARASNASPEIFATVDAFSMASLAAACLLRGGGAGHVRARSRQDS